MLLKDRLRQLRQEHNLTQSDVARNLHMSASAYGYYEQGIRDPSTESLQILSQLYSCSVDYLLGLTNVQKQSVSITANNTVPIPVLGNIKAGVPVLASENIETYALVTPEEARNGEYFYLRVSGDSMANARICDGDLVYVRRQEDVDSRDIAVVMVDAENATIKRVIKTDDGVILQPESSNPQHVPLYFRRGGDFRIIGKVIHVKFSINGAHK